MSKKDYTGNRFNNFLQMLAQIKKYPLPKNDTIINDYLKENIEHTLFLGFVDDQISCKNKRSTDFSDVNTSLLKKVISQIVKPFCHNYNVSFQTGVLPYKMKIAKVSPLKKQTFFYKLQANIFITTILKPFWRNDITTDWTCSLINIIYSVKFSMGLNQAYQQLKLKLH